MEQQRSFTMSMHLVGPHMTTTKYNRKSKSSKSKKLAKAQAEHEAYLKKLGVKGSAKEVRSEIPDYSTGPRVTSDKIGNGHAKERNVYSGERQLIGIATMHKSNMVPIFADKKDDAKDIASMRR